MSSARDPQPAEIVRQNFAHRLRTEIAERGWSQSDLAREASKHMRVGDVSRDNISNYVNQKALPGPTILLALSRALGTTPEDLLPERGAPAPRSDMAISPATDVRDAGEGMAFLRINRRLPWPVAIDILQLVNKYVSATLDDPDAENA